MRRNPGIALTKCCKTARLRQLANLIDQRRERRNTNGGRERPSEWGTTGGNEASARDNLRFVRVDLGRSQQAQNKLRPSTSWCSCQPCGDSPLSLEHLNTSHSSSFSSHLAVSPSRRRSCIAHFFFFPSHRAAKARDSARWWRQK